MNNYFMIEDLNSMYGITIPMALLEDKIFKNLSHTAKLLYGLLSDMVDMEVINGNIGETGVACTNLNIKYLEGMLDISEFEVAVHLKELLNINDTGIGLVQIMGERNHLKVYVPNFRNTYKCIKDMG